MPFVKERILAFQASESESEDTFENYVLGYAIRIFSSAPSPEELRNKAPFLALREEYAGDLTDEDSILEVELGDNGEKIYTIPLSKVLAGQMGELLEGLIHIYVTAVDQNHNESGPVSIQGIVDYQPPKPIGAIYLR